MQVHPTLRLLLFFLVACDAAPGSMLEPSTVAMINFPNPTSPITLSAGNNNNLHFDNSYTVIDIVAHASGSTVTGLDHTAYVEGDSVIIRNHSASLSIPFLNESTSSSSSNRFYWPHGQDYVLRPRQSLWVTWDGNVSGFIIVNALPGALITSVNTSPGRSLNSTFQPSTTNDVEVTYSVKITTTLTLTAGSAGHVDLRCDTNSPPTTTVATGSQESTGALTIGLNLQSSNTLVLQHRVRRGDNCRIVTTADTGSPTFTLVTQVEQPLG